MKIKFDVFVSKQMEIDVPVRWIDYVKAWLADEDERTEKQWDLLEHHSLNEMIKEFLPENEEVCEVEIVQY